jgi:hypothetical protein
MEVTQLDQGVREPPGVGFIKANFFRQVGQADVVLALRDGLQDREPV